MLKAKQKLLVKDGILMGALGLLLGVTAFFSAEKYLGDYLESYDSLGGSMPCRQDFFNVIFLWDNFAGKVYMARDSIDLISINMLYFLPFSAAAVWNYTRGGKDYYGFLAARSKKMSGLLKLIFGKPGIPLLIYTYAYILGAAVSVYVNYPDIPHNSFLDNVICLGLLGISRVLLLNLFSHFIFWIYLKWDIGAAVLSGYLMVIFTVLLDINIDGINICLFHYENYFADSIGILFLCNIAACFVERHARIRV